MKKILILVILLSFLSTVIALDWPTLSHDFQRTGFTPYSGPTTNTTLWTFTAQGNVDSSPAIYNGIVYIGSDGPIGTGLFYALNATNGTKIWEYNTTANIDTSPTVANDIVYFSHDQGFFAVNATNGTQIWNLTKGVWSSAVVSEGIVYIGAFDNNTYAFNATNGTQIWNYTTGNEIYPSPALSNGIIYIGSSDAKVYALNATNGASIWNYTTGGTIFSATVVSGDIVYVCAFGSAIYALNATNGTQIWNYSVGGSIWSSCPTVNDIVYSASDNNIIYAVNATNGTQIWNYTTGGAIYSSPSIADNILYIGSGDGIIYALNATNGSSIWNYTTGGGITYSTPSILNGVMYIGSSDNKVYAFGEYLIAPLVVINNPVNATNYTDTFLINATITDGDGLNASAVYYWISRNGQNVTPWTAMSNISSGNWQVYNASFNSSTITNGVYNVTINATDYSLNQNASVKVQINISNAVDEPDTSVGYVPPRYSSTYSSNIERIHMEVEQGKIGDLQLPINVSIYNSVTLTFVYNEINEAYFNVSIEPSKLSVTRSFSDNVTVFVDVPLSHLIGNYTGEILLKKGTLKLLSIPIEIEVIEYIEPPPINDSTEPTPVIEELSSEDNSIYLLLIILLFLLTLLAIWARIKHRSKANSYKP